MASKKKAVAKAVEEIIPATIVESAEVFPAELQIIEGIEFVVPVTETLVPAAEVVVVEPVTETAVAIVPAEKPKKPSKRPYIAAVQEMLEVGAYDAKGIVAKVLEQFPEVKKGGIQTFVTDLKNAKYRHWKDRAVVINPAGKLQFEDKIITVETPVETPVTTDEPTEQPAE